LGAGADAEFLVNTMQMQLYGAFSEAELVGDGLAWEPAAGKRHHLFLAWRKTGTKLFGHETERP
jgi:hypothetical protein